MSLPRIDNVPRPSEAIAGLRRRLGFPSKPTTQANQILADFECAIGVRVLVEPRAGLLLEEFPSEGLSAVLAEVVRWAADLTVTWVRVTANSEPDDPSWEEVVFKIAVQMDQDRALGAWGHLDDAIELVKSEMGEPKRALLDDKFAVHVLWGAWADEHRLTA
jgi:hypothetical protein